VLGASSPEGYCRIRRDLYLDRMDGPTQVSLADMKVKDVHELAALDTATIMERLAGAPFPPSEKLIGAVLLGAVDDLRRATADVAASSRQIDQGTKSLITLARLTLAIAITSLVVALVAVLK
jgi:hypothetical protein